MPEQRGHGHTADAGELSYELMAADTVAFLDAVVGVPVDVVGWSDGGVIAIHLALARPDLVRKIVTIGSNFHFEGTVPEFFGDYAPDEGFNPLRDDYARMSPDRPEHWRVMNAKVVAMWGSSPELTVDDICRINVPFLVLVADDDAVTLEHTLALLPSAPERTARCRARRIAPRTPGGSPTSSIDSSSTSSTTAPSSRSCLCDAAD